MGFERFHRQRFIDYQLNRLCSEGYARVEEVRGAAASIRGFEDCVRELSALADRAEAQGRLRNAAFYARAAELFVPGHSEGKRSAYERFVDLFYRGFVDLGTERHAVPYDSAHLPASRLRARGASRGTVLLFGGSPRRSRRSRCPQRACAAIRGDGTWMAEAFGSVGLTRLCLRDLREGLTPARS